MTDQGCRPGGGGEHFAPLRRLTIPGLRLPSLEGSGATGQDTMPCPGRELPAQRFRIFFGLEAPRDFAGSGGLTCEDYAVVRRRMEFHGDAADALSLCRMLDEELALRGGPSCRIGYV